MHSEPSCPASRQHPHRDQPPSRCQSLKASSRWNRGDNCLLGRLLQEIEVIPDTISCSVYLDNLGRSWWAVSETFYFAVRTWKGHEKSKKNACYAKFQNDLRISALNHLIGTLRDAWRVMSALRAICQLFRANHQEPPNFVGICRLCQSWASRPSGCFQWRSWADWARLVGRTPSWWVETHSSISPQHTWKGHVSDVWVQTRIQFLLKTRWKKTNGSDML